MLYLVLNMLVGLLSTFSMIPENPPRPSLEMEQTNVRQVDLAKTPVLNKILKDVVSRRDSTDLSQAGYYLFSVKGYKNGFLVKIVEMSDKSLYCSEDGYDGYVITKMDVPVIFSIHGRYKLKYKTPKNMKTFEMDGIDSPPIVNDPDNWWFLITGDRYKEIDKWTGIMMWTDKLEEYQKKHHRNDSTIRQ